MTQIALRELDKSGFQRTFDCCSEWARAHQAEIGIAEMALGAHLLSWGAMNGLIHLGTEVVGTKMADLGGAIGASVGSIGGAAMATTILKGLTLVGIGGVQGTIGVPALVLIGGATVIMSAFGYTAGDLLSRIPSPQTGYVELLQGGSIMTVGLALLIDGGRRIIKDERVLATLSSFKDGVIELFSQSAEIVASSWEELQALAKKIVNEPLTGTVASSSAVGLAGAAMGSSIATASITVAGSHTLGGIALSLGLVSAPIWPIVAGCAAGLLLGATVWKGLKKMRVKSDSPQDTHIPK